MYKILSIENDSVDGDVFYQTSDPKKRGYCKDIKITEKGVHVLLHNSIITYYGYKFILEEFYGK
jgi:hypothetical protein